MIVRHSLEKSILCIWVAKCIIPFEGEKRSASEIKSAHRSHRDAWLPTEYTAKQWAVPTRLDLAWSNVAELQRVCASVVLQWPLCYWLLLFTVLLCCSFWLAGSNLATGFDPLTLSLLGNLFVFSYFVFHGDSSHLRSDCTAILSSRDLRFLEGDWGVAFFMERMKEYVAHISSYY